MRPLRQWIMEWASNAGRKHDLMCAAGACGAGEHELREIQEMPEKKDELIMQGEPNMGGGGSKC